VPTTSLRDCTRPTHHPGLDSWDSRPWHTVDRRLAAEAAAGQAGGAGDSPSPPTTASRSEAEDHFALVSHLLGTSPLQSSSLAANALYG